MAKYNHLNYIKKLSTMKNETLVREYWKVCFKPDLKSKSARLRVLSEQMIKRFLESNPVDKNILNVY